MGYELYIVSTITLHDDDGLYTDLYIYIKNYIIITKTRLKYVLFRLYNLFHCNYLSVLYLGCLLYYLFIISSPYLVLSVSFCMVISSPHAIHLWTENSIVNSHGRKYILSSFLSTFYNSVVVIL
jgi:hypothetical protein